MFCLICGFEFTDVHDHLRYYHHDVLDMWPDGEAVVHEDDSVLHLFERGNA